MRKFLALTILLVAPYVSHAGEGGEGVGNGGDLVTCFASSQNDLNGDYALDFVISYDPKHKNSYLPQLTKDPLKTIWQSMHHTGVKETDSGRMAQSFWSFMTRAKEQISNEPNYLASYIWFNEPLGLIDIQDENLIQKVPANCKKDGKLNLTQAVILKDTPNGATLHYDLDVLQRLWKASPLQYSYLMVHEWLRGITKDAQVLRNLNKLVHSFQFLNATGAEKVQMFANVAGIRGAPKVDNMLISRGHQFVIDKLEGIQLQTIEIAPGDHARVSLIIDKSKLGEVARTARCGELRASQSPREVGMLECTDRNAGMYVYPGSTVWITFDGFEPIAVARFVESDSNFTFQE